MLYDVVYLENEQDFIIWFVASFLFFLYFKGSYLYYRHCMKNWDFYFLHVAESWYFLTFTWSKYHIFVFLEKIILIFAWFCVNLKFTSNFIAESSHSDLSPKLNSIFSKSKYSECSHWHMFHGFFHGFPNIWNPSFLCSEV